MDSEQKFWYALWSTLATLVVLLILGNRYYHDLGDQRVLDLVASGVPAIEAKCALENNYETMPVCRQGSR